jgi:Rod binding protein.
MDAATLTEQAAMAASAPRRMAMSAASEAKAKAAGKDFEAMFVTQMLNHMFTDLDSEKGWFGGGHAEAMFRPMLLEEYGKMIANHGNGIGIADKVTRVLLSQQEVHA